MLVSVLLLLVSVLLLLVSVLLLLVGILVKLGGGHEVDSGHLGLVWVLVAEGIHPVLAEFQVHFLDAVGLFLYHLQEHLVAFHEFVETRVVVEGGFEFPLALSEFFHFGFVGFDFFLQDLVLVERFLVLADVSSDEHFEDLVRGLSVAFGGHQVVVDRGPQLLARALDPGEFSEPVLVGSLSDKLLFGPEALIDIRPALRKHEVEGGAKGVHVTGPVVDVVAQLLE